MLLTLVVGIHSFLLFRLMFEKLPCFNEHAKNICFSSTELNVLNI